MIKCTTVAMIAAAVGTAVAMSALAEAPFSFDTAPGRLPKNVVPLGYTIAIVPDIDLRAFTGTESVTLQLRAASPTIVFNSLNETLSDVRLDHKRVAGVVSNDEQQLTTVTLAEPAAAGRHTLTFSYTGKIESQPHGLFAQAYTRHGGGRGGCCPQKWKARMPAACSRAGMSPRFDRPSS